MNRFRRSLALLLVFAMVFTTFAAVTVSAQTFSDVSGHWAEALIDKWSASGVINGYEDGTFRPDENITRAEIAKVISVSKGYTEEAAIAFSDVSEDDWFMPSLKKCVAKNVIGGYEDGTFRPDTYVNREEAATMIVRAYNINATALLSFTDSSDISPWAQNAVTALVGANVINGYEDGSFGPKNSITRAELVKMLDGAASAEILFPQATDSTGGTNSVGTIGNLGGFHGSGSTSGGGGGSSTSRSYNVTFDANGGSFENGRTSQSVSVSQNMVVGSRVSDPTKEGMKFDGWYTSKDAADQLISSKKWALNTDKVTKSMTLYAGWYAEGDVTVAFESCGGSAVAAQTVQSGNLVAEPAAPTRANYTFTGWYTDNKATKKFDFANTTIRKNTTLYAGWSLNADYTGAEITLPDETDPESNLKTGSVVAVPPTAIAGETVNLKVTAPEGFTLEGIKSITYLASVTEGETTTEQTVTLDPAAIKYNEETDTYSFVMPADAIGNVKIAPKFMAVTPTPKPVPSQEPTPTAKPSTTPDNTPVPSAAVTASPSPSATATATPSKDPVPAESTTPIVSGPTYDFSSDDFASYDATNMVPANKEVGGITVSKDSAIDGSNKTFDGSGYSYTRRLKIGTATLKFKVTGPCEIVIDAASASKEDRSFKVNAGATQLGSFDCLNGENPTAKITYTGGAAEITIAPDKGINVYGIDVKYAEVPSAAPSPVVSTSPTPTPESRYNISANDPTNGSVVLSNGTADTSNIVKVKWSAGSVIDAMAPDATVAMGKEAVFNLNGVDAYNGTVTGYEDMKPFSYIDPAGKEYRCIRGDNNPGITLPVTMSPSGAVFNVKAAFDGYITLSLYIFKDKTFNLYDNNEQVTLESFTPSSEGMYDVTFKCAEGCEYYFWAAGSKVGLESITWVSGMLDAKAGDTVTVKATPNDGYKVSNIALNPPVELTKVDDTTYTFVMPESNVSVDVIYINASANEYTITMPAPQNGSAALENLGMASAADDTVMRAYDGEAIRVIPTPAEGYDFAGVEVTDESGAKIEVNDKNVFVMPKSNVTVKVTFVEQKPAELPEGLTTISGAYTFIAGDFVTEALPAGEQFLDSGKVLVSGGNKFATNKKTSTIGDREASNCLGIKSPNAYVAFAAAQDSTVTVYTDTKAGRGPGAGSDKGRVDIVEPAADQNSITFDVKANQMIYISGFEPTATSPEAGGDLYLAGFTVTPKK